MSASRVEVRSIGDLPRIVIERWDDLIATTPRNHRAFLSPRYVRTVGETHGAVRVITVSRDDDLIAVLPLGRHRSMIRWLGLWEPPGGEMTDYFGLVARQGAGVDVRAILADARIACCAYTHLDEDQRSFGWEMANPRVGLRTRIVGRGEDHWAALRRTDKKLVADTERRARKLSADHGEFQFLYRSDRPTEDLAALIELKNAQYRRTGKSEAPLAHRRNVQLLERLLDSDDPNCAGVLSVLRVGRRLVAAHFGLRCRTVLHFWFPVYDEQFASYSPGRLLMKEILAACSLEGVEFIDRGLGDTQAKRDFANEEHQFFEGVIVSGLRGTLSRLALSGAWRVQALRTGLAAR